MSQVPAGPRIIEMFQNESGFPIIDDGDSMTVQLTAALARV
jgi:hypothetical protein